jgi:crotonobetainyl-CoA:carnitine CoA-transferase CaiB-like acyl-CoA transferase
MLLKPYRVIDLTRTYGMLCGQILADLGADVIQVEPPGGAEGRRLAPFHQDTEDPEGSLTWWAYSRGKRSIVLDIETPQGRDTLVALLATADVLVESEPDAMTRRGLGRDALAAHNPALVHVTITGFGSTGPKAGWAASDLVALASGGPLAITGDSDRAPVRVSVPQAFHHAAADAAVGALVALHERTASGRGQHVDVSAQQAVTLATQGNILSHRVREETATRRAGGVLAGGLDVRLTFPARDGFVSITLIFGATVGPATRRLMEYVHDEGFCDAATRDKDWVEYGLLLATGDEPIEEYERVKRCVAACTAAKTKAELLEAALERRLLLAPMSDVGDVVESPQFAERDYFRRPTGDGPSAAVDYPGAFARFSATPLPATRRPPRIGEHTRELLEELQRERVPGTAGTLPAPGLPALAAGNALAGVKVLDFMWALAGPGATRMLADFGATVVRVESTTRLDVCRTIRPFIESDPDPEKSAVFHSTNAGKLMLSLDLTHPGARNVVFDLVRWADVVTESFSPRAMKAFGLDYAALRAIKPDLIMLSTCLMGQTGPLSKFAGYGNLAAAIAGFYEITGWPDREPAGPFGAYTDYIAPRYNAVAVLAALDHRRRTGEGQHIDLAQGEAALHFIAPAILDYTANGRIWQRNGNADPNHAPHGVYPCDGADQWVAVACETDAQWTALCSVVGGHDFGDGRFATAQARLANQPLLDDWLTAYTSVRRANDVETALQAAGVPAAAVQNSRELSADVQLAHLGHFVALPHEGAGETVVEGTRVHLSRTPGQPRGEAPTFSRHLQDVLQGILGYDDELLAQLLIDGVLQ